MVVCSAFDIARSSYYEHRRNRSRIDTKRLEQRAKVNELFTQSRSSAGSRTILTLMQEEGFNIGRYKVRRLMREMNLVCKQPGPHAYKQATVERLDIPNHLNREFEVNTPNQVWCGDITYVWVRNRWHYLAAVLDLFSRRVVGWAFSDRPGSTLVVKALDMAFQQRGKPAGMLFHSDRQSVC
jgi:putative transposase